MSPGSRPEHVLVVDDERANLRLLERVLRRAGFTRVTTEENAANVLGPLADEVDVLLLDLHMPGVDGFDVITALRGRERPRVVVLSGDDQPETRERALAAGAVDVIAKGARGNEIVAALDRALARD